MELSYWEYKTWLSNIDFTVVGSGIVGLSCALHLKKRFPKAKVMVIERGILPQGASTKNAGFACFGSMSEILDDLNRYPREEVFELVKRRWVGLQLLRQNLGDTAIDFQRHGGYELFLRSNERLYQRCIDNIMEVNELLYPIFKANAFELTTNTFHFRNIFDRCIQNPFEGQLDTGKMMAKLLKRVQDAGVLMVNSVSVKEFSERHGDVTVKTNAFEFGTKKLLIATNGFAKQLLTGDVTPARAQVLITKPIQNLHIKGTFHMDEGYYYFRNIDDRILLGGARNLDFQEEETMQFGATERVQYALEKMLKEVILPGTPIEVDHRWSGIMGVGHSKRPIIRQISDHVYCGVRLGGMGIAIGSLVGRELADLV